MNVIFEVWAMGLPNLFPSPSPHKRKVIKIRTS